MVVTTLLRTRQYSLVFSISGHNAGYLSCDTSDGQKCCGSGECWSERFFVVTWTMAASCDPAAEYDFVFRVVLIGDRGVGKTYLMRRFVADAHAESHTKAVGVHCNVRALALGKRKVKIRIWDKGNQIFLSRRSREYRNANAIIVCYDVAEVESWRNVSRWLREVKRYGTEHVVLVLAGMKCDVPERKRVVSFEHAKEFAERSGMPLIEVSSEKSANVDTLFRVTAHAILSRVFSRNDEGGAVVAIPYWEREWSVTAHTRCLRAVQERVFAVMCAWRCARVETGYLGPPLTALPVEVLVKILEHLDHKDVEASFEFSPEWDAMQPQHHEDQHPLFN
eukprot:TRINITY_DN5278_c0_g2_i2.p1 TRINITY_DN5278_c0_g2~~TRINITY_DN5278_c0_g2_i2.p1  ORF type:complete len:336 (+),score=49.90 TRINITY_DN5278_c0_g2_i2:171-1178(+)